LGDEPLIDRGHLAAQTFGDEALAEELLGLFADQCRSLLPGIADPARPDAERGDLAHTLKGSALAIGAGRVAARAGESEDAFRGRVPGRPDHVSALATAVEETLAALLARR
jgi:HPt (histidine-containing phosphotransfer) domain-containing protein